MLVYNGGFHRLAKKSLLSSLWFTILTFIVTNSHWFFLCWDLGGYSSNCWHSLVTTVTRIGSFSFFFMLIRLLALWIICMLVLHLDVHCVRLVCQLTWNHGRCCNSMFGSSFGWHAHFLIFGGAGLCTCHNSILVFMGFPNKTAMLASPSGTASQRMVFWDLHDAAWAVGRARWGASRVGSFFNHNYSSCFAVSPLDLESRWQLLLRFSFLALPLSHASLQRHMHLHWQVHLSILSQVMVHVAVNRLRKLLLGLSCGRFVWADLLLLHPCTEFEFHVSGGGVWARIFQKYTLLLVLWFFLGLRMEVDWGARIILATIVVKVVLHVAHQAVLRYVNHLVGDVHSELSWLLHLLLLLKVLLILLTMG